MTGEEGLVKSLRNIGPVTASQLVKAGITTPEKLRKLGAERAFIEILKSGRFCGVFHATYLYVL